MATKRFLKYGKNWSNKGTHWSSHKYDKINPDHRSYHSEYLIWVGIRERCNNPKCRQYKNYGGRGIKVCNSWDNKETGFLNFYKDMGPRPNDKNGKLMELDRTDNDKGYSPDNCRWVDKKTNNRNRRDNIKISLFGEEYCICEACSLFGLKRTTVTEAIRVRNKSVEEAFINALKRRYHVCMAPAK